MLRSMITCFHFPPTFNNCPLQPLCLVTARRRAAARKMKQLQEGRYNDDDNNDDNDDDLLTDLNIGIVYFKVLYKFLHL